MYFPGIIIRVHFMHPLVVESRLDYTLTSSSLQLCVHSVSYLSHQQDRARVVVTAPQ